MGLLHSDSQYALTVMTSFILLLIFLITATFADKLPLEDHPPLRCCTLEAAPYVFASSRRRANSFDGLSIEYFSLLQERTGLRCESLKPFDDPDSVGWTQFIYRLANCTKEGVIIDDPDCECDIGVGAWFQSEDRMGVDFLNSHVYGGLSVLVHVDNTHTSTGGAFFITAFSPNVWLCIFALVCLFSFLKMLDRRFAPPDENFERLAKDQPLWKRVKYYVLKSGIFFRMRRAVQSIFGRMLGQSPKKIEGDVQSTRQWILNFVIALCGIFLILAYEATMTAFLVQGQLVSEFESIEDFRECRIPDSDICFVTGDIIETFWDTTIASKKCRENGENGQPRKFTSYTSLINAAVAKDCKFTLVDSGTALNYVHGRHCGKLITTGSTFNIGDLSMVIPKDSPLGEELGKATLELRGQDALDDTLEKYFQRRGLCDVTRKPQLDFRKLELFFILAFAAAGLIFIEMILDPQKLKGERQREIMESKGEQEEGAS